MRTVRLGDVCAITAHQVDPRDPAFSGLPLINGENIVSGRCRLSFARTAADEGVISPKYIFRPRDVLYSKLRPYLRKAVVAETPGLCSADMYPLTVDPTQLDPHWLCWQLVSDGFTGYANRASARARMPKLNREQLLAYEFKLPALEVQRLVAQALASSVGAAAIAAEAARSRIRNATLLRATVVRELVPLPPGGDWPWVPLSDAAEFLDHLREPVNETERRARLSRSTGPRYPYFGANGQAGWIDAYRFDEDLVLLAEDGGAFGSDERSIAYRVSGPCWVNNHAHVLRALPGVDIDYLGYALAVRPDVGALITGSTRGKLNRVIAASIPVSLPPIAEQRRIAAELRERLATIDQMTGAIDTQLEAIEALPAALLRRAFEEIEAA